MTLNSRRPSQITKTISLFVFMLAQKKEEIWAHPDE